MKIAGYLSKQEAQELMFINKVAKTGMYFRRLQSNQDTLQKAIESAKNENSNNY